MPEQAGLAAVACGCVPDYTVAVQSRVSSLTAPRISCVVVGVYTPPSPLPRYYCHRRHHQCMWHPDSYMRKVFISNWWRHVFTFNHVLRRTRESIKLQDKRYGRADVGEAYFCERSRTNVSLRQARKIPIPQSEARDRSSRACTDTSSKFSNAGA